MQAIMNDPFLGKRVEEGNFSSVPLRDEFLENARLFIFETYCRIHQRIDMGYVLDIGPLVTKCILTKCAEPKPLPRIFSYALASFYE